MSFSTKSPIIVESSGPPSKPACGYFPVSDIVEAMEMLNESTAFDVRGNGIHYEQHSDMRYFEGWLHEAGHMMSLEKKFKVYRYNGSREIGDRLEAPYGYRSEIRALSVEILAARLLGHPLLERRIVASAVFHGNPSRDVIQREVFRQVRECPTTRRYAKHIVKKITDVIRSYDAKNVSTGRTDVSHEESGRGEVQGAALPVRTG